MSPLVVGLTIVAFGTSAPELLISVKAALDGSPDMTMGNIVGSNICNLTLILGITALIGPIKVKADSIKIDWPVTVGSSLLLYFVVRENTAMIKTYEGIIFLILLVVYTVYIIRKSRKETKAQRALEDELAAPPESFGHLTKDIFYILIGGVGLYFGADWFVGGAKDLASLLGVSERVIGITVLALGTSLPELVTSIVASIKKETDLALGNLMGSNIFNILSILGITSIIMDIRVSDQIIRHDLVVMIGVTLLILPMMLYKRRLSKVSGTILVLIYLIYTYNVVT